MFEVYGGVEGEDIEKYLPLVYKIVNQLNFKETSIVSKDDLISVGVMGLIEAISRYDVSKNNSFDNYAKLRIRGSVMDELRRLGIVHRGRMNEVREYQRQQEVLSQELMREPSEQEICEVMQLGEKELSKIHATMHLLGTLSLDSLLYEGVEQVSIVDTSDNSHNEDALNRLVRREKYQQLNRAISRLNEREQLLLQLYYGEGLGFVEISDIFGISKSRTSQLYSRCLRLLRSYLKEDGLER